MLLRQGRRLTDRDVDAGRRHEPPDRAGARRPQVAVLGTGDELVPPGSDARPGEIVYSNGFALLAHGAQPTAPR